MAETAVESPVATPQPSEIVELDEFRGLVERYRWLSRLRPMALGWSVAKVVLPPDRRRLVRVDLGLDGGPLTLFLDPVSHLGRVLGGTGSYEPETTAIFQSELRRGQRVLDIGANEGFFSTLASRLVGPGGFVAAVEPQLRLRDLIDINLRLNPAASFAIFTNAIGNADGVGGEIYLYPVLNYGASSLVRRPKFIRTRQPVTFVSVETILARTGIDRFDFVKVDTEGYEDRVIQAMLPAIENGRIGTLLLDYHESILARRGVHAAPIHRSLLEHGMRAREGDPESFSGYVLYEREGAEARRHEGTKVG